MSECSFHSHTIFHLVLESHQDKPVVSEVFSDAVLLKCYIRETKASMKLPLNETDKNRC